METITKPRTRSLESEVKAVLSTYFSGTFFTIDKMTTDTYRYLTISYTDGPSLSRVKNAVKNFNSPANLQIHRLGVKVIVDRQISSQTKNHILHEIKAVFKMDDLPAESDWFKPLNATIGNYIQRIFNMRDF